MKNITILKYLLTSIDNGYIDKLTVKQIQNYSIDITVYINEVEHINSIYSMIEANMYTNKDLLAVEVIRTDRGLEIRTSENILYMLRVKYKRKKR